MTRAIHKMRGSILPIRVLIENFGNVNSTPGSSATFTSKDVGSGGGRTILIMATGNRIGSTLGKVTGITVDGTVAVKKSDLKQQNTGDSSHASIWALDLTAETGNVSIVFLGSIVDLDSWGLSYLIVSSQQSTTATDTATGGSTSTPVATTTTLDGEIAGIALGVMANENQAQTHTWSSLSEQTDVSTGGGANDHRHTAAYDLLPAGRAASTETVTASSGNRLALATATFR